jgi:DNA modification methylase
MITPSSQIICGDSSKMDILRNNEVDLIITSPPYFSESTGKELSKPIVGQTNISKVRKDIKNFALNLAPNYKEMKRVLKDGGYLALQTMDIYYGGIIIPLTPIHIKILENCGLNLISHFYWHKFKRHSNAKRFVMNPLVGRCRNEMVEDICIFVKGKEKSRGKVELSQDGIKKSIHPLWNFIPVGKNKIHPHQTPKALVKRLIGLYSSKGDLVVDPFAGSGTALKVAKSMGRNSVGYEITPTYANIIRKGSGQ